MNNSLVEANEKIELDPGALSKLDRVSCATITLILLKKGIRACFIDGARAVDPGNSRFVAEAFTLRFIPMREDISHPDVLGDPDYAPRKIVEEMPAGVALVIDARGVTHTGTVGGILAQRLKDRGCSAIVSDGAMRDVAEFPAIGMPVFCNGAAAPASLRSHYGSDFQMPIGCGNAAVVPGDIVKGDHDGVVVIPRAMANEVAAEAFEQERMENFLRGLIEQGRPAIGTYPPNEATLAEYETWAKEQDET